MLGCTTTTVVVGGVLFIPSPQQQPCSFVDSLGPVSHPFVTKQQKTHPPASPPINPNIKPKSGIF